MADAKTGKAYVRRTGVTALDRNTIEHEFDELLQTVSPHEEDGIRYKSGIFGSRQGSLLNKVFRPLISLASIVPSPFQPFAIAANIGTTASDIATRGFKPLDALSLAGPALGAFKGFSGAAAGSKLGGAFKGALGISSAPTSLVDAGTGDAIRSGISSASADSAARAAGQGSSLSGFGDAIASGIDAGSAASASRGLSPSAFGKATNAAISSAPTLSQRLATGVGSGIKKAGLNAAGSTLLNALAPPQQNPISGVGLQSGTVGAQGGQQSQNVLSLFGGPRDTSGTAQNFVNPISQQAFDKGIEGIDFQTGRQTQSTFDQFRRSQPGASIAGSGAFANQLGAISQGNQANRVAFTDQANAENDQALAQFKFDGVKNANGISDAKMIEYIQLSQQPDEAIRAQFPGMTPKAFREVFEGLNSFA